MSTQFTNIEAANVATRGDNALPTEQATLVDTPDKLFRDEYAQDLTPENADNVRKALGITADDAVEKADEADNYADAMAELEDTDIYNNQAFVTEEDQNIKDKISHIEYEEMSNTSLALQSPALENAKYRDQLADERLQQYLKV